MLRKAFIFAFEKPWPKSNRHRRIFVLPWDCLDDFGMSLAFPSDAFALDAKAHVDQMLPKQAWLVWSMNNQSFRLTTSMPDNLGYFGGPNARDDRNFAMSNRSESVRDHPSDIGPPTSMWFTFNSDGANCVSHMAMISTNIYD